MDSEDPIIDVGDMLEDLAYRTKQPLLMDLAKYLRTEDWAGLRDFLSGYTLGLGNDVDKT